MTDSPDPAATPGPDGRAADPEALQRELRQMVRLLLPTQQQLIDLRSRRDRELQVLETIIAFGQRVLPTSSENAFWGHVVDAAVEAFEYESCLVVELRIDGSTVLAARGPKPTGPDENEALDCALRKFVAKRESFVTEAELTGLRFAGGGVARFMMATIGEADAPLLPMRILIAAVTVRKQPFFPDFDPQAVPGHRMFASHVHVLLEMQESRRLIAGQVVALDRTNHALEDRIAEQHRAEEALRASEQRYRRLFEDSVRAQAEKERLQAQLAQSRQMESIGRLAGGIAHDFNNLLMVIGGNVEMMQHAGGLDADQRDHLNEVLGAARRAQELTQQLLMLSRKQVIRPVPLEMNRQIEDSLRIYRRLLGEDISLNFIPCLKATPILADKQQLDQVILNLLLNARDAIQSAGGTETASRLIQVSTDVVYDGSPLMEGAPAIRLVVKDTGTGMSEDIRANIFEPFFTTKDDYKGTGLGLSTVLGVVQQNEGTIDVRTAPGQGAEFIIHWPMRASAALGNAQGPEAPPAPASGEQVLLVEDDPQVRALMVMGLKRLGYRVQEFEHGGMALAALDNGTLRPDILVTDVVMPHMNGKELADGVRSRMPELPILFVSGYTDDIIAENGIVTEGIALLPKPFTHATLGQRVRELLDTTRRG